MSENYNCIIVSGPTAEGKTKLAVKLAAQFNGEIISIDSRQVYRGMNIGTGKDLHEYLNNETPIPYHLIDIVPPNHRYNVFEFANDFYHSFLDLKSRKKAPILCGGSVQYLDTLIKKNNLIGIPINDSLKEILSKKTDDELREYILKNESVLTIKIDLSSRKRMIRGIEIIEFCKTKSVPEINFHHLNPFVVAIDSGVENRKKNIINRLEKRISNGLIEETEKLLKNGVTHDQLNYFGLEYKFISLNLQNKLTISELKTQLSTAIIQYAKRQMTFLRKLEREGLKINWIKSFETNLDFISSIKISN